MEDAPLQDCNRDHTMEDAPLAKRRPRRTNSARSVEDMINNYQHRKDYYGSQEESQQTLGEDPAEDYDSDATVGTFRGNGRGAYGDLSFAMGGRNPPLATKDTLYKFE